MYQNSLKDYDQSFTPEVLPKEKTQLDRVEDRIKELRNLIPSIGPAYVRYQATVMLGEFMTLRDKLTTKKEAETYVC